jgi:hypothetical protein
MAYVAPSTRSTGNLVTATIWNQDVVANVIALKSPPEDSYTLNEASDYTTTSTSFVDIDSTNLKLIVVTTGGDVEVGFHGSFGGSTLLRVSLDIDIDGTRHAGDDGIICLGADNSVRRGHVGLSAGSHTFKLQWKVNTGTGTLYAGAGTAALDVHPQLWVVER